MTAFDYSDGMLNQAKQNAAFAGVTAEFVQGDAQKLPFEDETFDMIVTRNLTWNLEYPEKAYREWLRVLKKGGCILNYDGNYYLHYYDEEYRQEYEIRQIHHGDEHKYIENVDVNIINNVARDLPLSRESVLSGTSICCLRWGLKVWKQKWTEADLRTSMAKIIRSSIIL